MTSLQNPHLKRRFNIASQNNEFLSFISNNFTHDQINKLCNISSNNWIYLIDLYSAWELDIHNPDNNYFKFPLYNNILQHVKLSFPYI